MEFLSLSSVTKKKFDRSNNLSVGMLDGKIISILKNSLFTNNFTLFISRNLKKN